MDTVDSRFGLASAAMTVAPRRGSIKVFSGLRAQPSYYFSSSSRLPRAPSAAASSAAARSLAGAFSISAAISRSCSGLARCTNDEPPPTCCNFPIA